MDLIMCTGIVKDAATQCSLYGKISNIQLLKKSEAEDKAFDGNRTSDSRHIHAGDVVVTISIRTKAPHN